MTIENYQFHYYLSGNNQKPLILFLHGFMGNTTEFEPVISLLSDRRGRGEWETRRRGESPVFSVRREWCQAPDFSRKEEKRHSLRSSPGFRHGVSPRPRVPVSPCLLQEFSYLTVDLPGHGKTQILGGDECYNMANTAQALIELLDKLNIKKCFLVGYSMGGRLALYLTLHFPERFAKVVLESASPGLKTEQERLERVKRDTQIARKLERSTARKDFLAFLSIWYKQPIFGEINQHPEFEQMIENRLQNNPMGLAKSLQLMGTGCQPALWEKLANNNIPLLLLAGEYDEKFIEINREMAEKCQAAKLKIINNAGHNIHFENTLVFVESIREFFTKLGLTHK